MGRLGKWSNNRKMKNVFYFGLEPLKARYTYQLSKEWMPATFQPYVDAGKINFIDVEGEFDPDQQIKVGAVLDAVGRGKFAMSQCSNFLDMLNKDMVKDGDALFLQDYWHPGIESILYALDLYGISVEIYAMLHAQSVDEYDFTYPMRHWMRGFELGLDKRMTGIFVGSTIHREQLKQAGFEAPIHVVSLPIHKELTEAKIKDMIPERKPCNVIYSSRLDKEKNPFFMLSVAEQFLQELPAAEWHVTTSGKEFKSMMPGVLDAMNELAKRQPRFKLLNNLTKEEYYTELASARIQFNSQGSNAFSFVGAIDNISLTNITNWFTGGSIDAWSTSGFDPLDDNFIFFDNKVWFNIPIVLRYIFVYFFHLITYIYILFVRCYITIDKTEVTQSS